MTEDEFWGLIAKHITDDGGEICVDELVEVLSKKSVEEVIDFDKWLTHCRANAYSWRLWGAAYTINGGCSDDGFDYFRGWLIAKGRKVYESALQDPDSLVSHTVEGGIHECEDLLYVPQSVYEMLMGDNAQLPYPGVVVPELGEKWDFDDDDEMRRRYPKLFAKHVGDVDAERDETE
ncbi:MAG: DUF4240 domain-containing protein [Polyangiaceae bacterium]